MTIGTYCNELGGSTSLAIGYESQGDVQDAKTYRYRSTITLASQTVAAGDIVLCFPQAGMAFWGARITTSASLSTTTFGIIGLTSGTTYVATGQTQTATNTPTFLPVTAAVLAADGLGVAGDTVVLRIATTTLPSSGTLVIETFWSRP
jgi:hypothetical protein